MPRSTLDPDIIRQLDVKDEAIREFIDGTKRLMSMTKYHYIKDLEFAQRNMRKPLLEWQAEDVEKYVCFLEYTLKCKPSTVRRRIAALSSLYNYHVKKANIAANPVQQVELPKWEKSRTKPIFLNREEVSQLLSYQLSTFDAEGRSLKDVRGIEFRSILMTLILSGVRVSKLCSLMLDDFKELDASPYLAIQGAKGGKNRDIDLNPLVVKAYRDWLEVRPRTEHRFCYINLRTGNSLAPRTVQRYVKKIAQDAGIDKPITPHKFRHSFATLLLIEADANLKDIQELLGHESPETSMIYLHSDRRRKKELVSKLAFDL